MVYKIISGGQTGADQGGLEAGRELGFKTGGTAPLGWKTERGPMKELLQSYSLIEAGVLGYPFRTKMNVLNSDATAIFGDIREPGTLLTLRLCRTLGKPVLLNPCKETFLKAMEEVDVKVLNVAGNRESKNPGIQERVRAFLVQVLQKQVSGR